MSTRADFLCDVLRHLDKLNVTLSELLLFVLVHHLPTNTTSATTVNITSSTTSILSALFFHPATSALTGSWAHQTVRARTLKSIQELSRNGHEWHFNATHARPEQVTDFRIEDMVEHVSSTAPDLWNLVYGLLASGVDERRADGSHEAEAGGTGTAQVDDDEGYWDAEEISVLEEEESAANSRVSDSDAAASSMPLGRPEKRLRLKRALRRIKAVVLISILLHNEDQRCNLLQSTVGIFLHSCSAPEKLIKVLARMGISISLASIHRAIHSMSDEIDLDMEALGRTLTSGVGYNNFDFKLDVAIPTLDSLKDSLFHMTSATLLQLDHGIKPDDLRCSQLLWERSELNPLASDPRPFDPHKTMLHLYTLHPEPAPPAGTVLTCRSRFRSWFFQHTLFKHGPSALKASASTLPLPEAIESIPVSKLHHIPLRAMDINQSTVSGNIEALNNMLTQAGLGDPAHLARTRSGMPVEDISEHVVLVSGDLGTYERVLTAQRCCAQELTPFNRLQFVVFVPGLFHFKMAAADAIWRILVNPADARTDSTSFAKLFGKLRPNESSRLINNAKFRQQHELIEHVGALLQLDAWHVEVSKSTAGRYNSLEEWAESKPSAHAITQIADRLALEYVEGEDIDLHELQYELASDRDVIRENTLRTLNYLLLYAELSYAMNTGDIGRVETLYSPWVQLFRAAGKHKYATGILRFVHALYFTYPDGLQRAVRYNILVNPLGKPHHFRAVDWIIELLNLYIKVIYGGGGSNHTKARIVAESSLVVVYRSCHGNIERNFKLSGLTYAHVIKDMRKTIKAIVEEHLAVERPNETRKGRKSAYTIPDQLGQGAALIDAEVGRMSLLSEETEEAGDEGERPTAEDLSVEGII
ncbi:hypothetical protein BN946_scf184309.g1 [Trametes cinnabarina]|uniref:DUF6589 domain-containing protein n=1 Tax=Pycnoporus cinnabarinus TaxID=5643 RepID=A0A060SW02_PYCCI|nr:hypothetical protein BN946_scf184309.g1 [Trametes cinnabarina]